MSDLNAVDKCHQEGCDEMAFKIVYWPDRTPPPRYCNDHAKLAVTILNAMGIAVHVEDIQ